MKDPANLLGRALETGSAEYRDEMPPLSVIAFGLAMVLDALSVVWRVRADVFAGLPSRGVTVPLLEIPIAAVLDGHAHEAAVWRKFRFKRNSRASVHELC